MNWPGIIFAVVVFTPFCRFLRRFFYFSESSEFSHEELQPLLDGILEDARKEAEDRKKGRKSKSLGKIQGKRNNCGKIFWKGAQLLKKAAGIRRNGSGKNSGNEKSAFGRVFPLKERLAGMKDDSTAACFENLFSGPWRPGRKIVSFSGGPALVGESFWLGVNQN